MTAGSRYTAAEAHGRFGAPHELCPHWPTPRQSPPVAADHGAIPVLVTGGGLDVNTPPVNGKLVADRFPRGGFLNDSARPEGRGCRSATYQALGRFPLPAKDIPPAVTARLTPRQRTVLAAAVATVRDATGQQHPREADCSPPG
ncbi:alpha/beta hydrolase [Crossiella cryophila]|uniref:Peptidase S33 tripeptidyl aminopeptidase-like C-terminal domain-containing protein n=1 Tax=Crossiella cryophila TaxID=43355 RepID=A0A7W7CFL0_9PSEU|nr:alpha/beta hydrolase [Crossiella cryophila]MBB4680306.1 hypothetical protein [Crossiella cryophila]